MAEGRAPQQKVNWTSNSAYSQFCKWRKEVERILNGPMAEKNDVTKINYIFMWAGGEAEELIEARQEEDPSMEVNTPKKLLDQLSACISHPTSFREAREEFYTLKQKPDENVTAFYSRIMSVFRRAEFPEESKFLIVDKLISGGRKEECKRKLMVKGKATTAQECLQIMREFESLDITMKHLAEPTAQAVQATYTRDPTRKSQKNGGKTTGKPQIKHRPMLQDSDKSKCKWCAGPQHARDDCPAKGKRCNHCMKVGHFAKACLGKKKPKRQHAVSADDSGSDNEEQSFDTCTVHQIKKTATQLGKEIFAEATFHTDTLKSKKSPGGGPKKIVGKVDCGAMIPCLPLNKLEELGLTADDLEPTKAKLNAYGHHKLAVYGKLSLDVTCNGKRAKTKFIVTNRDEETLFGTEFALQFNLLNVAKCCTIQAVKTADAVQIVDESAADYRQLKQKWKKHLPLGKKTGDPLKDLKNIFPTMFDGSVGLFKGEVELKLSPDAKPIQLPPRAVPVSIMPRLKKQLEDMEKEGIIRKCPETTNWVHNIVIVVKKNGTLRLCLDPRNLNKYLVRNLHYIASFEDAQHSLNNGQYFSTLDAKSGYWNKKLSPESQKLTAFNTPFGKYCFERLPFGLSVSSEIFQQAMDVALDGIPGTFPCADDVKVQGSTEERHDLHLLETVERAQKAGLRFNPEKCQIKKKEVEYFGRIITPKGIKPCPSKVKDIKELAAPTDKLELQSVIGTVNFMSNFIPNLTKKTYLMRSLLKKDVKFTWTADMQKELDDIKQEIASTMMLSHFDPKLPVIIETDASLKGLGVVLFQNDKPVRCLSKALTPAETNYSNIERELLAIVHGVEKLHTYTFGRRVIIHTDHKPLEAIFSKPISLAPARLQRMLLKVRMYDLEVKYVGAKKILLADTLSRLISCDRKDPPVKDINVKIAQVLKIHPTRLETLQEDTKSDDLLMTMREYITNGWPESQQDIPEKLHPFWCFRDELTILDGLVMKGNRIVVPASQQQETLKRLHDAHQGLTSTLQRARRTVYWPKIQQDIEEMINMCEECQIHNRKKPRPPVRQVSATRPMEILGMDLMHLYGKTALITVDYFSGYLTYNSLRGATTEDVTSALNNDFRRLGIPERAISDNGPCFKADGFKQFCKQLDIKHTTSSPHYHQSNGRVERAIYTVKQILKKAKTSTDITVGITAYLDTPIDDNLPSPAELFFNRRINTRLGLMCQPSVLSDQEKFDLSAKRSKHLQNKKTKEEQFYPNQPVWFTEDTSEEWLPAYIESNDIHPNSYWIVTEKNRRIRRNHHDLKPRYLVTMEKRKQSETLEKLEEQPQPKEKPQLKTTETAEAPSILIKPPSPVKNTMASKNTSKKTNRTKKDRSDQPVDLPTGTTSVPSQPDVTRTGRLIRKPQRLIEQ